MKKFYNLGPRLLLVKPFDEGLHGFLENDCTNILFKCGKDIDRVSVTRSAGRK